MLRLDEVSAMSHDENSIKVIVTSVINQKSVRHGQVAMPRLIQAIC